MILKLVVHPTLQKQNLHMECIDMDVWSSQMSNNTSETKISVRYLHMYIFKYVNFDSDFFLFVKFNKNEFQLDC